MEIISKTEINAINIVLQHAENRAIQKHQRIRVNRLQALRFVFNIPLSLNQINKKAENVLSQDDLSLLIAEINRYLSDFSYNKISRHEDLKQVVPKLTSIKEELGQIKRFTPSVDHKVFDEIDLFNMDQGLQRLKSEIEVVIDDNEVHPLYNLFNEELSDEERYINRLGKMVLSLKNINVKRLVEILEAGDIMDSIYSVDLLINGLNSYEAEQQSWVESNNLLNTWETMMKLFYVRGQLNVYAIEKKQKS